MPTLISPTVIDTTQQFSFSNVAANVVSVNTGIVANGTLGTSGQVLTSNGSASYWAPAAGGGVANFIASGSIAAGDVVVLNSNGTVSDVANTLTANTTTLSLHTDTVLSNAANNDFGPPHAMGLGNDTYLLGWNNGASANMVIGVFNTSTLSLGATNTTPYFSDKMGGFHRISSTQALLRSPGDQFAAAVVTANATAVTVGPAFATGIRTLGGRSVAFDSSQDKYLLFGWESPFGGTILLRMRAITINNTTISTSGNVVDLGFTATQNKFGFTASSNFIPSVNATPFFIADDHVRAGLLTWNVSTSAYQSTVLVNTGITCNGGMVATTWDAASNVMMIVVGTIVSLSSTTIRVFPATVNSTAVTVNTAAAQTLRSPGGMGMLGNVSITTLSPGVYSVIYGDASTQYYYGRNFLGNSSVITLGGEVQVSGLQANAGGWTPATNQTWSTAAYAADPGGSTRQAITVYKPANANNRQLVSTVTAAVSTSNFGNWIGISSQAATNGQQVPVTIMGGVNDKQAGLIPNSVYYVQTNGALSTTVSSFKVGKALSPNNILVTVGNA